MLFLVSVAQVVATHLAAAELLPGVEPFLLGYGVLGAMFVLVMIGYLSPKWVVDDLRTRLAAKDAIIERQATALERLADRQDDMLKSSAKGGER